MSIGKFSISLPLRGRSLGDSALKRQPLAFWLCGILNVVGLCGSLLILLVSTETEAHAYTDPGSGALLWQLMTIGLVSAGYYARKVIGWFKSKKKDTKSDQ